MFERHDSEMRRWEVDAFFLAAFGLIAAAAVLG